MTTDGAPSDCVALAVLGLIEKPIDLVVSGINPHANVGHDVTYSGTVTAAMEAAISGLPAMAVSLDSADVPSSVEAYARRPKSHARWPSAPCDTAPARRPTQHQRPAARSGNCAASLSRTGLRVYRDALRQGRRGRPYYWIGGEAPTGILDRGTDLWALSEGWVSITPLQLDLTASRPSSHSALTLPF
jgi:5'-nucleotidase